MARITVQLRDGRTEHGGSRVKIIEEPPVKDTKAKTRSRLRDKRKKKEQNEAAHTTHSPGDVFVSKINWLGRRERGRQAY